MDEKANLAFTYRFVFDDGKKISFCIQLDAKSLKYLPGSERTYDDWARLDNHQCPNCTLNPVETPYCPIALNLLDILPPFSDVLSYEKVRVEVRSPARSYVARTTVQMGLGSLLGIYMVTSGCPVMSRLKPMVRFHLPFATVEETVYRSVSTYLLNQFFRHIRGEQADWNLDGLIEIYQEIQKVNYSMADRLRQLNAKDANINALIVLDVFARELPMSIDESLHNLEYIFEKEDKPVYQFL